MAVFPKTAGQELISGGLPMKKVGKPVFFVVFVLILLLTLTAFLGVSTTFGDIPTTWIKGAQDIRWGIDVRGGVDATFSPPDGYDATDEEMAAVTDNVRRHAWPKMAESLTQEVIETVCKDVGAELEW